jgi:hypothetical protein
LAQTPATKTSKTYSWVAELVAADPTAKTITIKAQIPEYVSKYTNRFKPGDKVTLVWNMLPPRPAASAETPPASAAKAPSGNTAGAEKPAGVDAKPPSSGSAAQPPAPPPVILKTESDLLLAIFAQEGTKGGDTGYILPAEFLAADAKTVTVKLRVPDNTLQAVTSIPPGKRLRATSPMSQATDVAAVSTAAVVN